MVYFCIYSQVSTTAECTDFLPLVAAWPSPSDWRSAQSFAGSSLDYLAKIFNLL